MFYVCALVNIVLFNKIIFMVLGRFHLKNKIDVLFFIFGPYASVCNAERI